MSGRLSSQIPVNYDYVIPPINKPVRKVLSEPRPTYNPLYILNDAGFIK